MATAVALNPVLRLFGFRQTASVQAWSATVACVCRVRTRRRRYARPHQVSKGTNVLAEPRGLCCIRRSPCSVRLWTMKKPRRVVVPVPPSSEFAGFRFPPEVIVVAVRWYLRFGLSYRDVEELLAERGIEVDHVTI